MLIKLGDAERVVHATIFDLCMKDKNTCAGDYSAYALQALRALPTVSDGWDDDEAETIQDYLEMAQHLGGCEVFKGDDCDCGLQFAINKYRAARAAFGPLPAPPTIEEK